MHQNQESYTFIRCLKDAVNQTIRFYQQIIMCTLRYSYYIGYRVTEEIFAQERVFLTSSTAYIFFAQFCFFTICDVILLEPEHTINRVKVISGLTTLLLYSILTYLVSKITQIFQHETGQHTYSPTEIGLYFLQMLLELIKSVFVVLCVKEQDLHYHLNSAYTPLTFLYYICTEKVFVQTITWMVSLMCVKWMDELEYLYVPIMLYFVSIFLAFGAIGYILTFNNITYYACLCSYFLIYLRSKDLIYNYVEPLLLERRVLGSFKVAEQSDIQKWNDVCAVCLESMTDARVTPCKHLFHKHCLKRWLKNSMQCPLCKHEFTG